MSYYNEIPFRKFNKKGISKWQFYDIESDSVYGDIYKSYNGIFITLLTILYVLFTNKLAEIFSNSNNDESQIASYVMTLYFINIMSLVVAFIWLTKEML